MSDLTPDDEALISAARGGLEATPEDRARIKGKLFAQIGIATGIAGSAISTSTAASAGAAGGAAAGAAAGTAAGAAATTSVVAGVSLTTKLILAAIVIGGAGGAIAIRQSAKTTNASTIASPPAATMPASASLAPVPNVAPTSQPEVAPAITGATTTLSPPVDRAAMPTPAMTNAPASTSQAATPKTNAASARDRVASDDRTSTSSPTTVDAPQATAVASGPTTVDAEAAILRNADAALKRGDAQGALALVDQHARQFPNGILAEERDAERVVVLCALGRTDEARVAGAAFLRAHPRSPQTSRIRASCAGN